MLRDVKGVDAACRRSKQRLLALVAIGGLGAPRSDYSTFTTFSGLNSNTKPEDLVRGVCEGIGFMIADIVGAMREAGLKVGSIRAAGGLSHIDSLLQFEADLLQSPIRRTKESEATALGVARLAAEQAGISWSGRLGARGKDEEFKPKIPADAAARLWRGWKAFVEAQQRVSAELRQLRAI